MIGPLRTVLFVPGDRPDRIPKAYASGADAIAVDLEDAVAASAKARARESAARAIAALDLSDTTICVRVNALSTGLAEDDLRALVPVLGAVDLVVLPMTSDRAAVTELAGLLADAETRAELPPGRVAIMPLIETAAGVLAAKQIAAADDRVHTLAFGPADLSRELGVTPTADGTELFHARSQVVLAAAAAGRVPPIDGPHLDLADPDGLARSAAQARRLGFGGKQVIHPAQLAAVRRAFAPSPAELAWARDVDQAFREAERQGVGSIRLADGSFVDYPIAHRARAILAAAAATGMEGRHS
jgi:citrate lyase subunit beta/citryl-CoA lyase